MSHGSFFWYDLISKNPAATRDFMISAFGYVASDTTMPNGTPYTSFSIGGNLICGLIPLSKERDFDQGRSHWIAYVQVDRLFSSIVRVERHGGQVLSDPMPVPDLGYYQIIRDSQGALLCLVESRHGILTSKFVWNSVIWNELVCENAALAHAFYRPVAGWTQTQAENTLDYDFFTLGGAHVAGILEMPKDTFGPIKPSWQTYMAIPKIDTMVGKVLEHGGSVTAEPFDLPGIGRIALAIDPGGCQLSLLQPLR